MQLKFKDGKSKVLTLSYDDGVVQDIRLIEIMKKHGLKGTFNLNSGCYLSEETQRKKFYGRLKLSECKDLYLKNGQEIAIHGYTHPFLEKLQPQQMVYEIMEDRKDIEKNYGIITRGMAYPFGTYSDEVVDALKMCGIVYSRTTKSTERFDIPKNWLELHPTCHHNSPKLNELLDTFLKTTPNGNRLMMFYLWGHSYEFDNNSNWNVIEEFCEKAGNHEDVWYATNIEIYDYIAAFKQLHISIDSSIIHNPTTTDVWLCNKGERFVVKSGETYHFKGEIQ